MFLVIHIKLMLQKMYADHGVSYLLASDDTVHAYEERGQKRSSDYDRGMEALSTMDRSHQVEMLHGMYSARNI